MKSLLPIGWLLLAAFCCLNFQVAFGQYYIVGQDPASVKWKKLSSATTNIVFPEGFEDYALRYANLLEISHKSVSWPYIHNFKNLPLVLHNRTVVSNAMVSPTPFRADFFTMPGQNSYSQPWDKQLTLHEYRHAAQMQKLNQGFTSGLKVLFGDQAIGAIIGVFLPFWFIEGDAVFVETIYSESGRGRSPEFIMPLKAQIIEKGVYSYDKALYGSYRDYTPDHYTLGYQLVTYGNIVYGNQLWNNTLNKVARKPFTLVPFTNSLKKQTGSGKVNYYKSVLKSRKKKWVDDTMGKTMPEMITIKKAKHFTSYRFPNQLSDGSVIAEKMGMDDINRFVRINPDGSEEILFTPGFDFAETLSANDSLLCWNEKTYDPRWTNKDYSVIKVYNYKRKKIQQLTKKSRLFSPSMANNHNKLVAVEASENNEYSLKVFSIENGDLIWTFSTNDNLFFMYPSWSDNDKYIVTAVLGEKGKSIIRIDAESGDFIFLIPWTYENISRPKMKGSLVIFTGSFNGTDNIYAVNADTDEKHILTDVPYGANDASFTEGSKLIFTNYTADGYRIANHNLSDIESVEFNGSYSRFLIDEYKSMQDFNLDKAHVPDTKYPVKSYSKIKHIFDIHSWGLAAVDLNNYDFQPGINIMSQNLLNTAWGTLGYYYDPNELEGKAKFDFTYAGWFPMIELSADFAKRRTNHINENDSVVELKWNETNVGFRSYVPLNLTKSKWITGIQPGIGIDQKLLRMITKGDVQFREDNITSLNYNLSAYVQLKRSIKDIFPKWGTYISATYNHTPFSDSLSSLFGSTLTIFVPGILNHHGIRFYGAYQKKVTRNYSYSNVISTTRGYTGLYLNEMISFKSDYALPLLYPDMNIPAVAYLKRITARGFYDYLVGKDINGNVNTYSSAGLELYTDWHFFSLIPNIRLGVRGTYRINDDEMRFEFLYGFSIN